MPIELVFRTIPGRIYEPRTISPVLNETGFTVADGKVRTWELQPGKYRVVGTSAPNGLAIQWSGAVECDEPAQPESKRLATTCAAHTPTTLTIRNPGISHDLADELGTGPTETMNLFVARLPDPIEIADADTTRLVTFLDLLVATTVKDTKSCNKMAADINGLIDANADVIAVHRRTKPPEWFTVHMNSELRTLTPALQNCGRSDAVNAAFKRLQQ